MPRSGRHLTAEGWEQAESCQWAGCHGFDVVRFPTERMSVAGRAKNVSPGEDRSASGEGSLLGRGHREAAAEPRAEGGSLGEGAEASPGLRFGRGP